jgi:hypothetical protein
VGVVTDLAEETFVEITVPKVFGADRANFVQRQLLSRFPDSAFRIALPPLSAGGLINRLAPPLQTLAAVDPGERIQSALQGLQVSIAGVWSTSLLLAQLGKKASMPANLFIVHCQGQSMRILFLKQRSPVLTRLITATQSAPEQAAEIVRTLRHLENTRVIERENQRFGVLLLGAAPDLASALAAERLDTVPPPAPWNKADVADWNHVLLDLAVKNPPSQLAPLSYRATYLARKWRQFARWATVLCVVATGWVASGSINAALHAHSARTAVQTSIDNTNAQVNTTDAAIAAFGVSPELVRKAVALDNEEIVSAPSMQADWVRLSRIIGSLPGARLKSLQWQVLGPSDTPCTGGGNPTATSPPPSAEPAASTPPARKVELLFSVAFPDGGGLRLLAQQTGEISRQLALLKGASVLQDPARRLREGAITTGGPQAQGGPDVQWCATLEKP